LRSSTLPLLAWAPTAKPVLEQDTTYLLDLDVEERLTTLSLGRLIGANEIGGTTADLPYFLGGSKVLRVPGKYRDGLKCQGDVNYGYLCKPGSGLWAPDQGTLGLNVASDVAWGSLSGWQTAFQILCDSRQYLQVQVGPLGVRLTYRHQQASSGEVNQITNFAHSASAGTFVNLAVSMASSVLTLYVDGSSTGTLTGCTPPVSWGDSWQSGQGVAVSVGSPNLTVSDLVMYRLARTPGVVPGP
jgi:hypothetical protein